MSEEQKEDLEVHTETTEDDDSGTKSDEFRKAVESAVEEKFKNLKEALDRAYKKVETVTKELQSTKAEKEKLARGKLEEEGKHLELAQMRIKELEELAKTQEDALTNLTRQQALDKAFSGYSFRNEFAKRTAASAIVNSLVKDEDGEWVHESGVPIKDYIKTFFKDPEKEFLLLPRENNGGGGTKPAAPIGGARPKSLDGLSSAELLDLARKGKI